MFSIDGFFDDIFEGLNSASNAHFSYSIDQWIAWQWVIVARRNTLDGGNTLPNPYPGAHLILMGHDRGNNTIIKCGTGAFKAVGIDACDCSLRLTGIGC